MSEQNPQQPQRSPAGTRPVAGRRPAGARSGAKPGAKKNQTQAAAPPPSMVIKKYSPVFVIKSKNTDDVCRLCRSPLDQVCNHCIDHGNSDPSNCIVTTGICGHKFHNHCITEYLKVSHSRLCPTEGCNTIWEPA